MVPIFVEAKDKKDLVKKMLEVNVKSSASVKFFDIQKDGKMWVAWYYADIFKEAKRADNRR